MSTEGVQTVMQNNQLIPIRTVYISNLPEYMWMAYYPGSKYQRQNKLKRDLAVIYDGPVNSVIARYHARNPKGLFAIVEFKHASTATAALCKTFCWSNGAPIRAVPAKIQPQPSADDPTPNTTHIYSDESRLRHLNDDCLLTVCQYLSFWDVLNLSETSAQLCDFVSANIAPKYARNCDLFVRRYDIDIKLPSISLHNFRRAINMIGPQLTHLSLNGHCLAVMINNDVYVKAVIENCPDLVSLRLFNMGFVEKPRDRCVLDGTRCAHLKELCLTRCEFVETNWITFINQLSSLETLVLHDSLRIDNPHEGNKVTPAYELTCSSLRKLSVCCLCSSTKMLLDAVMRSRATLRELYLDTELATDNSKLYEIIAEHLPQLESLWLHPLAVETRALAGLSGLQQLRKIILYKGDGPTTDWMRKLSAGPNHVEHLVLLQTAMLETVCENVGSFGSQIRVLELRQIKTHQTELAETFVGRLTELQTLEILDCPNMDGVLLSAIQKCPQLRRVVIRGADMDDDILEEIVRTLRKAADDAPKTGDVVTLRLELESHDRYIEDEEEERKLLQSNADILNVVFKRPAIRDRSFDNFPIDEYPLEADFHRDEDYDDDEELLDYDYDFDDSDDFDDYEDDDDDGDDDMGWGGMANFMLINENGLQVGNELLDGIIRGMHGYD